MEITRVKEVLALLADGIDPVTGEIYPPESPYQQPEIIRALFTVLRHLEGAGEKPRERKPAPDNAGAAWTAEQEEVLAADFKNGTPVNELAARMGRTRGAINSRLVRLGLLAK